MPDTCYSRAGRPPRLIRSMVLGDSRSIKQWVADLKDAELTEKLVQNRLACGWTEDEALGLAPPDPKAHPRRNPHMPKPKLYVPPMSNVEFRTWIDGHGYQYRNGVCEELATHPRTLLGMQTDRSVQPEVARLCVIIDLLDKVVGVVSDDPVVALARNLLVKHSGPKVALPVDQGRHAWDLMRANRLCALAAAVQSLACSDAPELAELRVKAVAMVDGWRDGNTVQNRKNGDFDGQG